MEAQLIMIMPSGVIRRICGPLFFADPEAELNPDETDAFIGFPVASSMTLIKQLWMVIFSRLEAQGVEAAIRAANRTMAMSFILI
jgi:hypothetical protein